MDLGVRDKAFVIVGGTRDMGLEAARVLAEDGARIALIGRDRRGAERVAAELASDTGVEAVGLGADAAVAGEVESAVEHASTAFGRVDGLLTTAGWVDRRGTVLDTTDDDFDLVQQNIYMSAVRACRAVLPHLLASRGGTIVTTGAYSIRAPNHGLHAYSAAKAAVANFTKNIAKTYGARGIRANCVCPGAVRTATVESTLSERLTVGDEPDDVVERRLVVDEWRMPVAMERLGRPREIGEMMAFLLSDRAAYTNGAIINVDGGTDF